MTILTFRHILTSCFQWIWGQWGRLSGMLVTLGVIVSLTIGMTRATRRYDALCDRVQTVFRRHDASPHSDSNSIEVGRRERLELLRKLDEILARFPADGGASRATGGPLSSSH